MSKDLAITSDQTEFTDRQVAALRQVGVDQATPGDLAVFFHQCQRTGLDPFARQIYMIGRWDKRAGRMKQTIQTSIDGFRLVAARVAERMGVPLSISAALLADPRTGEWREVLAPGLTPLAAKVTVKLGNGVFEAVARLDEYMPVDRNGKPSGLWGRMPATMIGKCAEALALRKACPLDLSGLYTAEEMHQSDQTVEADSAPTHTPAPVESELIAGIRKGIKMTGLNDKAVIAMIGRLIGRDATVEELTVEEQHLVYEELRALYEDMRRQQPEPEPVVEPATVEEQQVLDAEIVDEDGGDAA